MKTTTVTIACDVAGCVKVAVKDATTRAAAITELVKTGWRFGAVRDVCPDCREKGHRP